MSNSVKRRDVVRWLPMALVATSLGGLGRLLSACTEDDGSSLGNGRTAPTGGGGVPPTDDDEFVPGQGTPANAGDQPPTVPNRTWEARARQLEDEQKRLYGPVFTETAAGIFAGKERSHVPQATKLVEDKLTRVVVQVNHVMGANGLDAGVVYDGGDAGARVDAATDAGGDAGRDGGDGGASADAGDAGNRDAAADAATVDAGGTTAPVHYITTIYLRAIVAGTDTVVGLWEFASTDPAPPSVKFTMPAGVTEVTAYEWCTLHGLWKAAPLSL